MKQVGYRRDRVCDRLVGAVEKHLGVSESAHDAIPVGAQIELKLHIHLGARPGPEKADRFPIATHGLITVQRPGNRFENRRLPCPVRADDPGQAGTKADLRPHMLAEIPHLETVQSHAVASSSARPGAASASRR
jgi:hypothetical protein